MFYYFWTIFIYFLFRRSVFYLYTNVDKFIYFLLTTERNKKKIMKNFRMFLGVMKMLNNNSRCFKSSLVTQQGSIIFIVCCCVFFFLLFIVAIILKLIMFMIYLHYDDDYRKKGRRKLEEGKKITFVFQIFSFTKGENNPFICWN